MSYKNEQTSPTWTAFSITRQCWRKRIRALPILDTIEQQKSYKKKTFILLLAFKSAKTFDLTSGESTATFALQLLVQPLRHSLSFLRPPSARFIRFSPSRCPVFSFFSPSCRRFSPILRYSIELFAFWPIFFQPRKIGKFLFQLFEFLKQKTSKSPKETYTKLSKKFLHPPPSLQLQPRRPKLGIEFSIPSWPIVLAIRNFVEKRRSSSVSRHRPTIYDD